MGEKKYDLKMTMDAVEIIEGHFDMVIDDVFSEGTKFKAKDVSVMLWAMAGGENHSTLLEFKKDLSKKYTYNECIKILTDTVIEDAEKNAPAAKDTDVSS